MSNPSSLTRSEMKRIWEQANTFDGNSRVEYEQAESILAKLAIKMFMTTVFLQEIEENYSELNVSAIMLAVECHWLEIADRGVFKEVNFSDESIESFFAGVALSEMDFETMLNKVSYNPSWQRINLEKDSAVICMMGVIKNPTKTLLQLIDTDFILAAKCINSGSGYQIPDEYRQKLVRSLLAAMVDVRNAGEWRSADCARQLRLLKEMSAIPAIIATIKMMPIVPIKERLSDELAQFGKDALPFLLDALSNVNSEDYLRLGQYFMQAIEKIGNDQEVEKYMQHLREEIEHRETALSMLRQLFPNH